jgi:hypothetical protein
MNMARIVVVLGVAALSVKWRQRVSDCSAVLMYEPADRRRKPRARARRFRDFQAHDPASRCGAAMRRGNSASLDAHIQYDSSYALHATGVQCGALFCFGVADAAREFDHAMMDLDADRTSRKAFISLEFRENFLLNLRIIFHFFASPCCVPQNGAPVCNFEAAGAQVRVGQEHDFGKFAAGRGCLRDHLTRLNVPTAMLWGRVWARESRAKILGSGGIRGGETVVERHGNYRSI